MVCENGARPDHPATSGAAATQASTAEAIAKEVIARISDLSIAYSQVCLHALLVLHVS